VAQALAGPLEEPLRVFEQGAVVEAEVDVFVVHEHPADVLVAEPTEVAPPDRLPQVGGLLLHEPPQRLDVRPLAGLDALHVRLDILAFRLVVAHAPPKARRPYFSLTPPHGRLGSRGAALQRS